MNMINAKRWAAFAAFLGTLSANAQLLKEAYTFSTPDLQAFEVKGHVKRIIYEPTAAGPFRHTGCSSLAGEVCFNPDGTLSSARADIARDNQGRIVRANSDAYEWSGSKLVGVTLPVSSDYTFKASFGDDGCLSELKCTKASSTAEYQISGGSCPYLYKSSKDAYGNWTSRLNSFMNVKDVRQIEYYNFEADYNRFRTNGTLHEIETLATQAEQAEEYSLFSEAKSLWNTRAVENCRKGAGMLASEVEYVIHCRLSTITTRSEVLEYWKKSNFTLIQAQDDPTQMVQDLMNSELANEAIRVEAQNYWNSFFKTKIEKSNDPLSIAEKIINSPLLYDSYRDWIIPYVHNYEVEHNVNGVKDYDALMREADIKLGGQYVFSEDERASIRHNAESAKREHSNEYFNMARRALTNEKYSECIKYTNKVLELEPDYKEALVMRAEAEYALLWDKITKWKASLKDLDNYIETNSFSSHAADVRLIRELYAHANHKNTGPHDMLQKIISTGNFPTEEKVMKTVEKCAKED